MSVMAQSGPTEMSAIWPLSGVKRTSARDIATLPPPDLEKTLAKYGGTDDYDRDNTALTSRSLGIASLTLRIIHNTAVSLPAFRGGHSASVRSRLHAPRW